MNEKQLFSVLVRTVGLFESVSGIESLWSAAPFLMMRHNLAPMAILWEMFESAIVLAIGVAMFRRPGWVVRLAGLERLPTTGRMTDDEASS